MKLNQLGEEREYGPNGDHETDVLLQRAREIAVLARQLAPQTEADRRLAPELAATLRASGLLRLGAPSIYGSAEAPPAVTLECAETVARGDASAGWCVSINCTASLLSGLMPAAAGAELFGGNDAVAAGVWMPGGRVRPVEDGYRVAGRWAYCSGITHSDYLFAGCVIDSGDEPAPGGVVAIPTNKLEILDNWKTSGLRGTGSHDTLAHDVFVPSDHVFSLFSTPVVDSALYRFPPLGYFALSIAAAALGNARGAIDDLVELAGAKLTALSRKPIAHRQGTQTAVAEAEAALRAARALFYGAIDDAWRAAQRDEPVSVDLKVGLRLAGCHAARTSADVVRAMYDLGGGTAVYEDSPLQRRFRDAHTATAHFQVNHTMWETLGRHLLGLDTLTAVL